MKISRLTTFAIPPRCLFLASGAVDIIQPDPSHAGGITETRKIATMAEAYDVAVALHCPLGPLALATCLQLDACTYNAFIQEQANVANDLLNCLSDPGNFRSRAWHRHQLGVRHRARPPRASMAQSRVASPGWLGRGMVTQMPPSPMRRGSAIAGERGSYFPREQVQSATVVGDFGEVQDRVFQA